MELTTLQLKMTQQEYDIITRFLRIVEDEQCEIEETMNVELTPDELLRFLDMYGKIEDTNITVSNTTSYVDGYNKGYAVGYEDGQKVRY